LETKNIVNNTQQASSRPTKQSEIDVQAGMEKAVVDKGNNP
jgi:hypothetical protein